MVAFVASVVALVASVAVCLLVARRRPPGTPLTWGEALVAATFVFGVMVLAYGVVPNQWLLWADNELNWRADAILGQPSLGGRGQVTVTKAAIKDLIAVAIYGVMLGLHVFLWMYWQNRGKAQDAVPAVETSTFGRPLVRRT